MFFSLSPAADVELGRGRVVRGPTGSETLGPGFFGLWAGPPFFWDHGEVADGDDGEFKVVLAVEKEVAFEGSRWWFRECDVDIF